MAKPPLSVKFRRVRRTFELPPQAKAPARAGQARPLPPEKAARVAARELARRAVEGEVMQVSFDGGGSWSDVPPPASIETVDETLGATGEVWADDDGSGAPKPKKAPKIPPVRGG